MAWSSPGGKSIWRWTERSWGAAGCWSFHPGKAGSSSPRHRYTCPEQVGQARRTRTPFLFPSCLSFSLCRERRVNPERADPGCRAVLKVQTSEPCPPGAVCLFSAAGEARLGRRLLLGGAAFAEQRLLYSAHGVGSTKRLQQRPCVPDRVSWALLE